MNCVYTVNHKKVAAHLCHNIGKSGSIFRIFALFMQEEIFKHVEICLSQLNTLSCENETSHFILV